MRPQSTDLYSAAEIALAAGVSEAQVLAALYGGREPLRHTRGACPPPYLRHADAVRLGRALVASDKRGSRSAEASRSVERDALAERRPLFSLFDDRAAVRPTGVPLALSSTLHAGLVAFAVFVATFNLAPRAATLRIEDRADPMRLVFIATPGPGGGGGGGGLQQKAPPPKAMREGRQKISSPLPQRREPKPVLPRPAPPEPKPAPPLQAETLPAVVAPIIVAPADTRNRVGVLEQTTAEAESHGPGKGGGAGTGAGTGLGPGDGSGVGPGSGGGTGGGPYRPGSGIEPPRLVREVRADYTEEARQRGLSGEVVLEIVVRRDGSVGDVKILRGMAAGLNERAVQAVRQWRFAPATRLGQPVDVIVEVAVEFRLR